MSQEGLAQACAKQRLQVSLASIKRAESGKNVLYRIIANLACFYQVTIEALIDDTPLFTSELWVEPKDKGVVGSAKHVARCSPIADERGFIGREWELKQLGMLYDKVCQQAVGITAYISGMAGLGKTRLLTRFLTLLPSAHCRHMMVNTATDADGQGLFAGQVLGRQLLGIGLEATANEVRRFLTQLPLSPLQLILMLWLCGVNRSSLEREQLARLDESELLRLLHQVLEIALEQCCGQGQLVIVVDDFHLANQDFVQLVKALTQVLVAKPVLLLLGVTDSGRFSSVPHWLSDAYVVALRALDPLESTMLLKQFAAIQQIDLHRFDNEIEQIRVRGGGHPRLLQQLLLSHGKGFAVPTPVVQSVLVQMHTLCVDNILALRIAAMFGYGFSSEQVYFSLRHLAKPTLNCSIQSWVYAGLIRHAGADYCFQHPLIREAVLSQLSTPEREELAKLCNLWLQNQIGCQSIK